MTRACAIAEQERLFPTSIWERVEAVNRLAHLTHRPTLPEICLDLRASLNGAADPWPAAVLAEVVGMLQTRLDTWADPTDAIDAHVRGMVRQAVWLGRAAEAEMLAKGV